MKHPTIRIEGAILSGDILEKIENAEIKGQKPVDFNLPDKVTSVKVSLHSFSKNFPEISIRVLRHPECSCI